MANPLKNGGPAFPPNAGWRDSDPRYHGMSLRDWFAGQALVGLIMNDPDRPRGSAEAEAYRIASAMLAARLNETESGE